MDAANIQEVDAVLAVVPIHLPIRISVIPRRLAFLVEQLSYLIEEEINDVLLPNVVI